MYHWVGESHGGGTIEERCAKENEHIQEECLWENGEEWGGLCHRVA
jgi:hypothetical protein